MNNETHEYYMRKILHDIFQSSISENLAFKGGTLAYFVHNLDRFSTDIDIDLLDIDKEQDIILAIQKILLQHGEIKTEMLGKTLHRRIFRYDERSMNIKVELNKRIRNHNSYSAQVIDGLPILCMDPKSMFTNKLVALSNRRYPRDLYDVYFFVNLGRDLDELLIVERTDRSIHEFLDEIITEIPKHFPSNYILHGMGEVLTEKQKLRVKNNLVPETIQKLTFYKDNL